jgi:hypothetical protein
MAQEEAENPELPFQIETQDIEEDNIFTVTGTEKIGEVLKLSTNSELREGDKESVIDAIIQNFKLELSPKEQELFSEAISSFYEGVNLTFDNLINDEALPEEYKQGKPKIVFYKLNEEAAANPRLEIKYAYALNMIPNLVHQDRDIMIYPEFLMNEIRKFIEEEGTDELSKLMLNGKISFSDYFLTTGGQEAAHSIFLMANPEYEKEKVPGTQTAAYNSTRVETDGLYGELLALYKKYEKLGLPVPIEAEEFILSKIKESREYRLTKKRDALTDELYAGATRAKEEGESEADYEKAKILAAEKYLREMPSDEVLEKAQEIYRVRNNPFNKNVTGQIFRKAISGFVNNTKYSSEERQKLAEALQLLSEIPDITVKAKNKERPASATGENPFFRRTQN